MKMTTTQENVSISLRGQVRKLTIPIFIEMLLVTTMGATDTFMLSQYADDAVAAVGVANQLITFAFLVFQIINIGTTVLCSQYLGAGRRDKMVQVTAMALLLNIVSGALLSMLLSMGAPFLLGVMGIREDLMGYGCPYMELVGAFAFFQALHMTISASLRADNKVIYPMLVVLVVNIVNALGNYAFIFGHWGSPAMGVVGAAASTVLSRGVATVTMFVILFTRHIPFDKLIEAYKAPFAELKNVMANLLRIGLPSAGENMSYNAQQVVLTYFINMLGNEALTTRMYVINAVMFVYVFCICVSQGASIVIGHLVGDNRYYASYKLGWYSLKLGIVATMVMSVIFAFCGGTILSFLTDNAEIIALGSTIFILDIAVEIGKVCNIFYTTVLRSVGDVNFPFYVGITVQWLVGVLFGWMFGLVFGWGLIGMWISFFLDEGIRGLIFVWRWHSKRWQQRSFVK